MSGLFFMFVLLTTATCDNSNVRKQGSQHWYGKVVFCHMITQRRSRWAAFAYVARKTEKKMHLHIAIRWSATATSKRGTTRKTRPSSTKGKGNASWPYAEPASPCVEQVSDLSFGGNQFMSMVDHLVAGHEQGRVPLHPPAGAPSDPLLHHSH